MTPLIESTATPFVTSEVNEKIILRLGAGDSGDALNPHQQIIQLFELKNKNVFIQLEAIAGTDYYSRLMTLFDAHQIPDVIYIADDNLSYFVKMGVLTPLDINHNEVGFDPSLYYPGLLEPGKVDGKQYLLPRDFSTLALYFNKKLFDKAGIPYPTADWTWEDLLSVSQKLTVDKNKDGEPEQWGIQMNANWESGFEYWVAAAGGSLISQDGRKYIGYMDSPETVRALTFYSDLYNTYNVAPHPADLFAWAGGNTEFMEGKAAMVIFGRWVEDDYLRNPNIDLGITSPPRDKARANILFWSGTGITSTSKHPVEAVKFLTYYNGLESGQIWKDWNLPVITSIVDDEGYSTDTFQQIWYEELNFLKPRGFTRTPYWDETARPAITTALETMLLNPQANPKQVMNEAAKNAQTALDEYYK